jgi:phosphatidate cytidylyltransferase
VVRVLSAAVLIGLVIVTVWWLPPLATLVVSSVVAAIAAGELGALAGKLGLPAPTLFLGGAAGVLCVAVALAAAPAAPGLAPVQAAAAAPVVVVLLALVLASGTMLVASGPPAPSTFARAGIYFLAPLYVGGPLGALSAVRLAYGPAALTVLVVLVIVSDSAQYYAGRLVGRHKLAPSTSPAKTVEGALGGLLGAALAGALVGPRGIAGLRLPEGAGLGATVAAFGMVGDLFESLLKRSAGVKDSSSLIPGHGGLLDRLDSWLFAAPVYYLLLRYVA